MMILLLAAAAWAAPFFGLEYSPFSRGDLTWVDEDRTSGALVGEFDGLVRPNLQAFVGGWVGEYVALSGTFGVARLQNVTWVEDIYRQRHWGVLRPGFDVRIAPLKRQHRVPTLWFLLGCHGDIPSARDISNGYTDEEQEASDETALGERARLGGVGARVGVGVEQKIAPTISVGALYAVEWQRSVLESDDASAVSSWLSSRAALMLTFHWPGRKQTPSGQGDESEVESTSKNNTSEE
ncbi:MAG: hypothetical protein HN348_03825 [Proteobacteria bacterium]|jgi:hypothetical protein|nr:hypothetical protein [Pseudomonadota bacterium]